MTTGDLISIRHDEQVIVGYASDADKLIQGDTLVGLLNKRVLALDEPPRKGAIREPGLDEVEAIPVLGEKEGLEIAREGGVRFEEDELRDVRVKLVPADGENIKFIVEEDGIEDAAGGLADAPAVKPAESLHGDVLVVVVGDVVEGLGRGFPQWPEEVGDLLSVKVDDKDAERDADHQHQQCPQIESSQDASQPRCLRCRAADVLADVIGFLGVVIP